MSSVRLNLTEGYSKRRHNVSPNVFERNWVHTYLIQTMHSGLDVLSFLQQFQMQFRRILPVYYAMHKPTCAVYVHQKMQNALCSLINKHLREEVSSDITHAAD